MAPAAKKISKTVAFSQDADDQALLTAIEQALADKQYPDFPSLCKQALKALLFPVPGEMAASEQSELPVAQWTEQFDQIQTQLKQLGQQLSQVEKRTDQGLVHLQENLAHLEGSAPETEQLENHLSRLLQQSKQLDARLNQQFSQLQRQLDDFQQSSVSGIESTQLANLENYLTQLALQLDELNQPSLVTPVPSEDAPVSSEFSGFQLDQLEALVTQLSQQMEQMEDRTAEVLEQFATRFANLESLLNGQAAGPVERQLTYLVMQVEQLDHHHNHQFQQIQQQLNRFEETLATAEPAQLSLEIDRPTLAPAADSDYQSLPRDSDPLLSRLGPLLEDF